MATVSPPRGRRLRIAHVTTIDESLRYLLLGQLLAIRRAGGDVVGVSAPGPNVAELQRHGIPHLPVPLTRRVTPLADVRALARLAQLFRRHRFDIVHTHTPKPGLLGQVAARLARVPIVVNTIHGFYFHDRMRSVPRAVLIALERVAAVCSTRILSQSAEDVETALALGIAPAWKVRHLGNGIDIGAFSPARFDAAARQAIRARFALEAGDVVVGFVGRLVREKGIDDLLAACSALAPHHPRLRLLVVGAPDRHKADTVTARLAEAHGVATRCRFVGHQADMPPVYAAMDIFCLPSYREGMPRSAMEASAMGRACVVTDVRGCREVVAHRENGLVVPAGDPPALAAAIGALLIDEPSRVAFGRAARRRAEATFDERRVFRAVIDTYRELASAVGLEHALTVGGHGTGEGPSDFRGADDWSPSD